MEDDKDIKTPFRVRDRVKGSPATRDINDRNGNTRFRRVVTEINQIRRLYKPDSQRFTVTEAGQIYNIYAGRCCFCGRPLNAGISYGDNMLCMIYYIPLDRGGEHDIFNLVPTCPAHKKSKNRRQEIREDIPDINTFADVVEKLIDSVVEFKDNPTKPLAEKIRRIKRMLNFTLDEVAINMRYKPFTDWLPEQFEIFVEEDNTIPDRIETLIKDKVGEEPEDVVASDGAAITDAIKQTLTTGQYLFVRNPKEK